MGESKFGRLGNFKVLDIEGGDPNPFGVEHSWLDAYKAANFTFPQSGFYINIHVAQAILENPPKDWHAFGQSRLGGMQIEELGRLMSMGHARLGVQYSTKDHKDQFEKKDQLNIVKRERLQKLWTDTASSVEKKISQIVNFLSHEESIDKFFASSQGKEEMKKVLHILKIIESCFQSKPVQEELKIYRKKLVHEKDAQGLKTENPLVHFWDLLDAELKKSSLDFSDPLTKKVLEEFRLS